ncbi:phospholipase [Cereibacter changlensis]|uniref:Phospholipase D n=1 Tax=Cereibacter changlensis TaxID=402884 RepID=A0A4U0YR55_9RHOB|nr:phospholipase D-like domain-containing protein [Cereibacter changlensis]TKA94970.1 phospholipase [Cereibacter changlensis]
MSSETGGDTGRDGAVLRPGDTCWRIERAARLAVIVDAADYFRTIRTAIRQARHSVILIGWDFDTRILLDPLDGEEEAPNALGKFLDWAVKTNPDLNIHMLKWDLGMLQTLGRGSTPLALFDWLSNDRIHIKLDHAHPTGAAHHQKIVVIDDTLAFCGGIDMTADRWDTRDHADDDPHRVRPTSKRAYGPWHDITTAVDGDAARALAELARERWKHATGAELAPPPPVLPRWPEGLEPTLTEVDVAISRTLPGYDGREAVHEIEALYLAAIAATRRVLYIESQYFASRRIAEAMIARLREPEGPEIVVINPETADGWLEEEVMGSSRARLLRLVREADIHSRFRIYTPVTEKRQPIYVHAKVLVMDDRLLRVGSSNLNNRSMGFDTECDLSVEAGSVADVGLRHTITGLRNDLLAEHLGRSRAEVEGALEREGSLIAAIEALRSEARSLVAFEPPELNAVEDNLLRESDLLDPERPSHRWRALNPADLVPWWN